MKLMKLIASAAIVAAFFPASQAFANDYTEYTSRAGESWTSIHASQCRAGTQAAALAQYNGASVNSPIAPSTRIRIPNSLSNQRSARIQTTQGTVTVDGRPARNGTTLTQGSQIQTAANGRADIILDNGSVMRVGPSTRITLQQLSMNGRNTSTNTSLANGSLTMQVTRMNRDSTFQVSTVSAVAGVRGTYFYINYDETSQDVGVACYSGRVVVGRPVTDAAGNTTVDTANAVSVDAGHATTISGASGAVAQPFPIPGRIRWADETE